MTPEELHTLPYRSNVGIVLMNDAGLIFAAKRNDTPGDAWQMPQGGIDGDEKPKEAALRELYEETGVSADLVEKIASTGDWVHYDLPDHLLGKAWGGKYRGQRQKWFLFRFTGRDDQINIETDHPEFSEWQWMSAEDIQAKIVPFKKQVYETVFSEFQKYLK